MAATKNGRMARGRAEMPAISQAVGSPFYLQLIVPVAVVAGGILLFRKLRRTAADRKQKEIEAAYQNAEVYDKEVTITKDQANIYAKRLLAAMDRKGTDENTILAVLNSLRTHSDLLMVQKAFGAPLYMFTGSSNSWFMKKLGISSPLDLNGWLRAELSGATLENVRQIYQRLGEQL